MTSKQQNIPALRFPEFEEEWEKVKLSSLTTVITKGTTPKKFIEQGINFIKIEGISASKIDKRKCLFISPEVHNKELRRSILFGVLWLNGRIYTVSN